MEITYKYAETPPPYFLVMVAQMWECHEITYISAMADVAHTLARWNFSSEWCRCGDDMKKPWMGST